MSTGKVIGTLMMVVGLAALLGICWQAAVGVFLVVWGNDLWRGLHRRAAPPPEEESK